MKQLIVFAFLVCISCTNQDQGKVSSDNDTVRRTDSVPNPSVQIYKPELDTIHRYDYRIYEQMIPKEILSILKVKLPDWRLPDPKSFEAIFFNYYKKEDALLNYFHLDFNCDEQEDYTFILENPSTSEVAAWVLRSDGQEHQAIQLEKFYREGYIENSIELVARGEQIQDFDTSGPANPNEIIKVRCEAIRVQNLGSSSRIYFWNKDKFKYITETD